MCSKSYSETKRKSHNHGHVVEPQCGKLSAAEASKPVQRYNDIWELLLDALSLPSKLFLGELA